MELLLYIIVFVISFIIFRFICNMIILSLFFGIPQTIKFKKNGILSKDAPIIPFLKTILLQSLIILLLLVVSFKFLNESYFIEIVWGMVIAFFSSFEMLSKKHYSVNIENLKQIQSDYFVKKKFEHDTIWQSVKEEIDKKKNLESLEENAPEKNREL